MERSSYHVTPSMMYEREGAWQANALQIRVDGTEKTRKHEFMYFLDFWCACVLIGWVLYHSIHSNSNIPQATGGWKIVYFDNRKNHNSTTYSSTARIIGSTELWHLTTTTCPAAAPYRITESTEWHFNKTRRVSVTGGGDYYYHV